MANVNEVSILRELAALDWNGINTIAIAASAYRAGIAYGREQGMKAAADLERKPSEVKA